MNTICKSVFHHAFVLSVALASAAATTGCQSDDSTSPITHVPDASSNRASPGSEGGSEAGHEDAGAAEAAASDAAGIETGGDALAD